MNKLATKAVIALILCIAAICSQEVVTRSEQDGCPLDIVVFIARGKQAKEGFYSSIKLAANIVRESYCGDLSNARMALITFVNNGQMRKYGFDNFKVNTCPKLEMDRTFQALDVYFQYPHGDRLLTFNATDENTDAGFDNGLEFISSELKNRRTDSIPIVISIFDGDNISPQYNTDSSAYWKNRTEAAFSAFKNIPDIVMYSVSMYTVELDPKSQLMLLANNKAENVFLGHQAEANIKKALAILHNGEKCKKGIRAKCPIEAFPIGIITDTNWCDWVINPDCEMTFKIGFTSSDTSLIDSDVKKHWWKKYSFGFICDEFEIYGRNSTEIPDYTLFENKAEKTHHPCSKIVLKNPSTHGETLKVQIWEDDWDDLSEFHPATDDMLLNDEIKLPTNFMNGEIEYAVLYKERNNVAEGNFEGKFDYVKAAFVVRRNCIPT